MKLSSEEMNGIVDILSRLYREIHAIETKYSLRFGNGDYRPRIDYFHDAVRAVTDDPSKHIGKGGRLSVELLAYDITTLRYLQAMPLAVLGPNAMPRSPHTAMQKAEDPKGKSPRPPRDAKMELGELYQQYAVLFSALFKPFADNDYHERNEHLNDAVQQFAQILDYIAQNATQAQIQSLVTHVDDPKLRAGLLKLLRDGNKGDLKSALKEGMQRADGAINELNNAQDQYAMAQFGLFEEGKDIIKKLAGRGMNLAGNFVKASMAEARSSQRGR